MKNILKSLIIVFALVITISSCGKDKKQGEAMYGTYEGKVTDKLLINYPGILVLDTNFLAPGIAATGSLGESAYNDSLSLRVQLNVDGTPIDITVLAHVDSESSFTIPKTIYPYLGAVDILVSGSGTVDGNDAKVNVKLAEADGTTDAIFGDLNFKGSR